LAEVKLLLDTHALLWTTNNDSRLGENAAALLESTPASEVAISGMTLLEIAMLASKKRITLGVKVEEYLLEVQTRFTVMPLGAAIACEAMSVSLPEGDPFDRVVVATARHHRLPLVTRDREIQQSGLVEIVW
jgi:PIN domain nuclease of toxin-antitoxin system